MRCAVAVVVVAAAGYGVYQAQANQKIMSEIALANVEALASSNESNTDCTEICFKTNTLQICVRLDDWGACLGTPKYYIV